MSRSYKKHPFASCGTVYKGKQFANKKVRKSIKIPCNKAAFKRMYCSWDIKDYTEVAPSFETFYKEQIARWEQGRIYWWKDKENPPTKEACKNTYAQWYLRK